jgi:hypothetical protein
MHGQGLLAMKTSLALLAMLLVPSLLMAGSIRCGSRLILRGSTSAELMQFCGDPAQVDKHSAYTGSASRLSPEGSVVAGSAEEISVEIWTYNFGPDSLMERVRIENGTVVQIDSLGYGYN